MKSAEQKGMENIASGLAVLAGVALFGATVLGLAAWKVVDLLRWLL